MPCCQCCCGGVTCAEGQQGKCCCGGPSGTCCQVGEYCCDGVCQNEPCESCDELSGQFSGTLAACETIQSVASVTNTLGVPALLTASGGVDDDVLINGSVHEPGKYPFNWNAYGNPCGSTSEDNGSHSWSYETVLQPGASVVFGGKDNGFGGGVGGSWTLTSCIPTGACVYYQTLTACYQWSPSADDPNRVLIEGPCDECGDDCWSGYLGQETGFCVEKSSEQECLNAGGEEWLGHGSFTTECWYSECNDMYFLYRDCDPTGGGNPLP